MPSTATIARRTIVLQLFALGAACASSREQVETGVANVDGAAIAFKRRAGAGPTIVFESGLGDGLESWEPLFQLLPANAPFFAYSRPGYGDSAAVPILNGVVSASESAQRLRRLLTAANVRGPYVLVGHSLGGLYIIRFAELYPEAVRAMVFVDARPPGFFERCAQAGASCGTRVQRSAETPATVLAEAAGIPEAEAHGIDTNRLAGIPATVITATRPGSSADGARVRELWIAEQHAVASTFRDSRFVEAADAGHYVHHDNPALVAREIAARL